MHNLQPIGTSTLKVWACLCSAFCTERSEPTAIEQRVWAKAYRQGVEYGSIAPRRRNPDLAPVEGA